ncbi:nuclear matrix protein NMP200 [Coprinellus micaceus]|uniref:Pre-mRNA-processing factor 19 n=1 Tax=Coprinellus micaceus TaxID=71717 RepID=A0A4Y7TNL5_COPMI|nr:nuclear matrix protein NMP200 [Coprinellus micaceus]
MFFCAISGEPPQEPVVSSKSGKVFEKRLILKYIHENGTDPTTGKKLEESDLITIKASPENAAPRPPSHTSIPALLQLLQNEWDALVLSTHSLEQKYNSTRQELSYSLYAQDAAQRVVARLIRERDAAREALSNVQASMDVEMGESGLPADVVTQIDETHKTLSAARKKKKPPTGYASTAEVKSFTATHTIPSLHSASPAGITSLALSKTNPSQFLTGGNDHIVQLYDRSTDKVLASLRGHSKKVNHVAFREKEGDSTLILSAGADKIAKVWGQDSGSGEYIPKATIRSHKAELTGLVVHPTQTIFGLSSADKTYSLFSALHLRKILSPPSLFTPDGTLFALGTPNSTIHIYDVRTGAIAASLTPPDATPFTVNTLSFSENGYHLAAPSSHSTVAIWDLRHEKAAASIGLGDDFKINKGARVFANKSWEELVRLEEGGEVSDLAWGEQGKEIWGATGREVRIWGIAA